MSFVGSGRRATFLGATRAYLRILTLPRQINHAILNAHARVLERTKKKSTKASELGSALTYRGQGGQGWRSRDDVHRPLHFVFSRALVPATNLKTVACARVVAARCALAKESRR